jgi:methylmalonyl-CoA mutase C-terminal domain/subunit
VEAGARFLTVVGQQRLRVLVAKVGLDGHDVGARVVARGLADAGMEVVYTGIRRTPEHVAAAARDEAVDVVGLSILSGAHLTLVSRVCTRLAEAGMQDVVVVVGGIVPEADIPTLQAAGVTAVFHPSTTIAEIAEVLEREVARRAGRVATEGTSHSHGR